MSPVRPRMGYRPFIYRDIYRDNIDIDIIDHAFLNYRYNRLSVLEQSVVFLGKTDKIGFEPWDNRYNRQFVFKLQIYSVVIITNIDYIDMRLLDYR